nr:uncharacterized protein LOC123764326 [Procambarus clarkii]
MAEKRVKRKYCVEDLAQAVEDVKSKRRSIREASSFHKIPRATLAEKVAKGIIVPTRYGPQGILSDAEEECLINYIIKSNRRAYPTTRDDVLNWVEGILKKEVKEGCRRKRPTGCVNFRPGKTWWKLFRARHPEVFIMSPVFLSKAKRVVTETSVHQWFSAVREYLCEEKCADVLSDPSRNFYMDEVCFSISPTTGKVNSISGAPDPYLAWLSAQLKTITVLAVVAADGKVPSPVVVFPGKILSNKIIENRPLHLDCSLGLSNSGCMTVEILTDYLLNTFDPWLVRNNITKPVILWTDWHETRVSYYLAKELQERQIIMYGLPLGTKPFLQPLHVSVFAQLEIAWEINASKWCKENQKEKLDCKTFLCNFLPLYYEICTPDIIKASFKTSGIHPFDSTAPDYSMLDSKKYITQVKTECKTINKGEMSGRGGVVSGQGGVVSGRGGVVSSRGGVVSSRGGVVSGQGGVVSGRGRVVSSRGGVVSGQGGVVSGRGRVVSSRGGVVSGQGGVVSGRGRVVSGRGRVVSGREEWCPAEEEWCPAEEEWCPAEEEWCLAKEEWCPAEESGVWQRKSGVRQRKSGVWQRKSGVRQRKSGVWQRKSGVRQRKSGVQQRRSGVWPRRSGVRQRKSGVWQRKSGVRQRKSGVWQRRRVVSGRGRVVSGRG